MKFLIVLAGVATAALLPRNDYAPPPTPTPTDFWADWHAYPTCASDWKTFTPVPDQCKQMTTMCPCPTPAPPPPVYVTKYETCYETKYVPTYTTKYETCTETKYVPTYVPTYVTKYETCYETKYATKTETCTETKTVPAYTTKYETCTVTKTETCTTTKTVKDCQKEDCQKWGKL